MAEVFPDVHRATARVLARNGFEVIVPREQGCCGALQAHAGDLDCARELARHNARVFDASGVDAVVVNSAGCGAAMRDAEHWIGAAGGAYAAQVRDICELLDEVGLRPPEREMRGRYCYDDPCHLVHGQGVESAPRNLLARIPGLERVDHAEASACCGAAGIYNITHPAMSQRVLARKLDSLERARPDWIATGNPGCMMQIAAGARARGMRARVVHPVELLDEAYGPGL
jgi:glycolate oxidase iron-sulfur subunit